MSINSFRQAREKYRPANIKVLFITEAPPAEERQRYFYYEHVRRGDSLFMEMIKVLFTEEVEAFETVKTIRREKTYFLERLQEEGYYLMGAVDQPLPGKTAAARTHIYRKNLPALINFTYSPPEHSHCHHLSSSLPGYRRNAKSQRIQGHS